MMLEIDGSQGEGGGQILRTSLSLAALTGRPFRLSRIRAGRSKPGLRPQHLTAVHAAAAICGAAVEGGEIGSQKLAFLPGHFPASGRYRFDVDDHAPHGSAGSAALIAQTVIWPLLFARSRSQVVIRGGTHVPYSPSFHYLQYVSQQAYRRFGMQIILGLHEWGWLPAGRGQILIEIEPLEKLTAALLEANSEVKVQGLAVVTNLPGHIPHRMARRADNLLEAAGLRPAIEARRLKSHAPGAGLFLWFPKRLGGAGGLGRKGLPAQSVAENAVDELLLFAESGAAVDYHLADQLLLPMALAEGVSRFTTPAWSTHSQTNAALLRQWLGVVIDVHERPGEPVGVVVRAGGREKWSKVNHQ